METTAIDNDIKVFYITATSFPEGIMAAHEKLHARVADSPNRNFYGLSRPENGAIVYKAAAEELQAGEGEKLHCETLIIKKGKYVCATIENYLQHLPKIETTFAELLKTPGLDPNGYCVEWYFNETDVKCMVRLNA